MSRREINLNQLLVKDFMSNNVKTINSSEKVGKAAQMMWNEHIHCLIVLSEGKLAGILTALDLANIIMHLFTNKNESNVEDFLSSWTTIVVSPEDSMKKAIDIMAQNNISHVPVMEDDEVIGILSSTDLIYYIAENK